MDIEGSEHGLLPFFHVGGENDQANISVCQICLEVRFHEFFMDSQVAHGHHKSCGGRAASPRMASEDRRRLAMGHSQLRCGRAEFQARSCLGMGSFQAEFHKCRYTNVCNYHQRFYLVNFDNTECYKRYLKAIIE